MSDATKKYLPEKFTAVARVLIGIGCAVWFAGYVFDSSRAAVANLIVFLFAASIAGGSLFLVALEYIGGAVWSVPMRRVNEFLAGLVPLVPLFAIPLFFNLHTLFHWTHLDAVQSDPLLQGKEPYLNVTFFVIRFIIVFLLWMLFYFLFIKNSIQQDISRDQRLTTKNIRLAAVFLPVFAISISVLAIDWGMSLEPHWYSTIYSVYFFSGAIVASVAAGTLVILIFHDLGLLPQLRRDHFYSLGALMFAFVNFWAYIAFSQFLLMWYANLPEEVFWFIKRWNGGWEYASVILIILQFAVPYGVLLSQEAKMDPKRLRFIAIWILVAHFFDMFWLVMPTFSSSFTFGWMEIGFPILLVGVVILLLVVKVSRYNTVPIGDPKLQRGLDFRL
ncbi:MAG: quinol:cytochrome C oxidoreductase [Ignavibacteriales bacterium]|nr:quinol:cytochrome C oxidoreductase [Ignavibacteriales bacterium]